MQRHHFIPLAAILLPKRVPEHQCRLQDDTKAMCQQQLVFYAGLKALLLGQRNGCSGTNANYCLGLLLLLGEWGSGTTASEPMSLVLRYSQAPTEEYLQNDLDLMSQMYVAVPVLAGSKSFHYLCCQGACK